jgi:hypothetical protein
MLVSLGLRFRSGYGLANLEGGFEDRTDGKHAAPTVWG